MEGGRRGVEANGSIRAHGETAFGTRGEGKNMNSFRSVERGSAFEIERQAAAIEAGEAVIQETRGWDEDRQRTVHQRLKEYSGDYRYFPEPDLPPLRGDTAWLERIRGSLAELPAARRELVRSRRRGSPSRQAWRCRWSAQAGARRRRRTCRSRSWRGGGI